MKISTGIRDLDNFIDFLYVGDNVVWEVESGTSPEVFVLHFIRQSFSDNSNVIYVSFNNSPNAITQKIGEITKKENFVLIDCFTAGKGKNDKAFTKFYDDNSPANFIKVDDPRNIEIFISSLNSLEDKFQSRGRYIFDSLTGMQDLWGDENRTYKFFTYLCPRLYDLGTVAYWILEKDAHSQKFKANLRHITQVVVELYKRKDKLWIKALKLDGRPNRKAFKPHSYEITEGTISITSIKKEPFFDIGTKIKELRKKIGISQKELADKVDLTPSFISQLESNQINPSLYSFIQICNALGISFLDMFNMKSDEPKWLIRKDKIFANQIFKEVGSRGFSIVKNSKFSATMIILDPYFRFKGNLLPTQGKRLLYVLKGDISMIIDGICTTTSAGDFVYIKDEALSLIKNEGGDSAEILLLTF